MSDVIDLDALSPKPVTIKLGGQEYKIEPPSVEDVLLLSSAGEKIKNVDPTDTEAIATLIENLKQRLYKCAPAIKEHPFNTKQLLAVVDIIMDMSIPEDAKELAKKGITVGDPDPKEPAA